MFSTTLQINPSLALRCISTKAAATTEFMRTSCMAATYPGPTFAAIRSPPMKILNLDHNPRY